MSIFPGTPIEISTSLIGMAVGACYGLDGWVGAKKKTVELRYTPRISNLKYGITGFFAILIADLSKFDEHVDKPRLLVFYVVGFLVVAAIVIALMALSIHCDNVRYRRSHPEISLPPEFGPVKTYVQGGYADYLAHLETTRLKAEEGQKQRQQDYETAFLPRYAEQLQSATLAVSRVQSDPGIKVEVAKEILDNIRSVVIAYYRQTEGLVVDANYMVAYPKTAPPATLQARLQFVEPGAPLTVYGHFLVIEGYARGQSADKLILPVMGEDQQNWKERLLPGAPEAFMTGLTSIINDTREIPDDAFQPRVPASVQAGIKAFLRKKAFQSFASVCIRCGRDDIDQIGVVNIESSKKNVFGVTEEEHRKVDNLVRPFCYLLGLVIRA